MEHGIKGNHPHKRQHITTTVLYTIFLVIFTLGYIFGVLQSSGWCAEKCDFKAAVRNSVAEAPLKLHSSFLTIIIFSAPKNAEQRRVIRKTWLLTSTNDSILHFFVIGTGSLKLGEKLVLESENIEHNDLLLLASFSDTYSKLSEKLLRTFQWLDRNTDYTLLLKVDDDSFVRLDRLLTAISGKPMKRLYWGFFNGHANIKSKGKWAEKNWNLCDTYLPYALGGGYVISVDLVHHVVELSDYLTLYQSEDVALGTWLAPLNINRVHDSRFDTEYMSRGCFNDYIITHKQSTMMMINKYKNIVTVGKMCTTEYKKRSSYEFNWNVLPSQCCFRNNSNIH